MLISQTEEGISNFSASSKGGINNSIESFIPFLPHPRELKNDNSLIINSLQHKESRRVVIQVKIQNQLRFLRARHEESFQNFYVFYP